ncbi:uncharacterized protein LOC129745792 [Uranotaenia lowii]|uniref:uncharacterized protein LOC129745792 n=1 Tax=Uranotaenia lowii TaxID=190385 RepID=UPI00247AB16B|nr:uncharacterized protein LOC129745792 [Uranotaenia lowii]
MMISSVHKINEPCYVDTIIERKRMKMEIDCGSAESVISEQQFNRNFGHLKVKSCNKRLVVIDGKRLNILGKTDVNVQLNGNQQKLSLVILQCSNDFVPLLGRTWLDVFYTGWRKTFTKPSNDSVHAVKEEEAMDDIMSVTGWQNDFSTQASA